MARTSNAVNAVKAMDDLTFGWYCMVIAGICDLTEADGVLTAIYFIGIKDIKDQPGNITGGYNNAIRYIQGHKDDREFMSAYREGTSWRQIEAFLTHGIKVSWASRLAAKFAADHMDDRIGRAKLDQEVAALDREHTRLYAEIAII